MRVILFTIGLSTIMHIYGCTETRNSVHEARVKYCSKTSGSVTKKIALKAIKMRYSEYPEDGICNGVDEEAGTN